MARVGFVASLLLSVWAAPAAAEVCLTCETVACELTVETVADCQVVPSNHELILRATCPELVEVDVLPRVRRTTGEVVPGDWERLERSLYRFVGARFPRGEELRLVGRAPERCYMANVPSCTSSALTCLSDALEPKDCCALYEEAAQTSWDSGQGGQGGDGPGEDGHGEGGQGGSTGSSADEPIWLRFFASEPDETPPDTPLVEPVCTGDGVGLHKVYLNAPGTFDEIQQLSVSAEGEGDAKARPDPMNLTPCLTDPWIFWGYIDSGVHRIQLEYRDWSGNVTRLPERLLRVPEDCSETPTLDGRFACEKPTYPVDQACLERPLAETESTTDVLPNLCDRYYGEPEQERELEPLLPVLEPSPTKPPAATGGAPGSQEPSLTPPPGRGCACTTVGGSTPGPSAPGALIAAFCGILLLGRRQRPGLR